MDELEREYGVTNAIKLASNENPWGPSPKAVAAIGAMLMQAGIPYDSDDARAISGALTAISKSMSSATAPSGL